MNTKLVIVALLAGLSASAAAAEGMRGGEGRGMDMGMGHAPAMDFAELDTNADGNLTLEELKNLPAARFAKMDANTDGNVSAEELTAYITAQAQATAADRAAKMIERMDANTDGQLTAEELTPDDTDRRDEMFDRLFSAADADKDGNVTQAEFDTAISVMQNMRPMGGDRHGEGQRG